MRFEFPFSEFAEINKWDMSRLNTRRSQYEISVVVWEWDKIVNLVLLEFKCFDNVLNLQTEQVNKKNFVIECHYDFVQPYFHLLDLWTKIKVCNYLLSLFITQSILSSNIAKRFGGVKGVYFSPTKPMRLLLLISYTNWRGVPKSRWCLRAKGCVL